MRRIVTWCLSTLTILVLLFGYHTSTSGAAGGPSSIVAAPVTSDRTSDSSSSSSSSTDTSGSAPPETDSSSSDSSTVTGPSVDTRWGPVQVEVTVAGGRITAVTAPVYPSQNPKDQEINAYALPILIDATMQAQSASIDMVSGATVTSQGYITSLQGAIDEAGL